MANPARVPDPRHSDPLNPVPPATDPFAADVRDPANTSEPPVVNRVEARSGGSSVLIAAIVLVLAVVAYFVFAPGTTETPPAPTEPAATTTEPAPAAPAPDATAPVAPADNIAPAPDAVAPAPAPAEPAPEAPALAPAPAEPAPAQ